MNTTLRRSLTTLAALVPIRLLAATVVLAELWFLLKPPPGEWSRTPRVGRFEHAVSLPALLRNQD